MLNHTNKDKICKIQTVGKLYDEQTIQFLQQTNCEGKKGISRGPVD